VVKKASFNVLLDKYYY